MKKLLLLFILAFWGCNFKNDGTKKLAEKKFKGYEETVKNRDSIPEIIPGKKITTVYVPSDFTKSEINMDEILDSVFYVRLETNSNSLIGDIDKLLFFDDFIIVIEIIKRQSILLFSKQGKFLKKIGRPGKGPGEYLRFVDVAIDSHKKNIIVLDDRGQKIIHYDFNGNHIEDQKLLYFSKRIAMLDDGSFIIEQIRGLNRHLYSISDYNLLLAQSNLSIIGKILSLKYRDKFPNNKENSNNSFNVTNIGVLFNPLFSDTIFEFKSKNSINAKYCINLGSKNITLAFDNQTTSQDFLDILNTNKYYYFDGNVFETDKYLYFDIFGGGECFYSKQKNKLYYGNFWKYTDDRIMCFNKPLTTNDNFFVGVIQPYSIIHQLKLNKFNSSLNIMLKDIKNEDNPILFFYSLK